MGKKAYAKKVCKAPGCLEVAHLLGFCRGHYSRHKHGILNADGAKVREPYSRHPFNKALHDTLRLVRKAGRNAEYIQREIDVGNPHLTKPLNKRLHDINKSTAAQEHRLTDSKYVFGNIHLMNPRSVQLVLGDEPVKRVRKLSEYDEARVAWYLLRGKVPEVIVSMLPAYSMKQVRAVAKKIADGTLPLSVEEFVKERKT